MKRLVLVGVLVGSMMTLGCRSDHQRCEDVCETSDDCVDANNIDVCIDECVRDTDLADDSCMISFEAMADCMSLEDHDCPDSVDSCDSEIEDFYSDCDEDFAHFEFFDPFLPAINNNPEPL
jgi:hypothetical protein